MTRDDKRRAAVWTKVRAICATLEGVVERASHGNPAFRAGKRQSPFVVLDVYRGASCLWVKVDPGRRAALLADSRFFPSPYDPRQQALCCTLDGANVSQFKSLIYDSYSAV